MSLEKTVDNIARPKSEDKSYPEPDGAMMFAWAELALLALELQIVDHNQWLKYLPALLRAEEIYTRAYGYNGDGKLPSSRRFNDYAVDTRREIDLNQNPTIDIPPSATLERWQQLQTQLTQSAFPGEVPQ